MPFRVAGGSPGWQVAGRIFRSLVSAIGYQVRVFGFWCRFGEIDCPTANRLPLTPIVGRANHPWLAAAEQGCSALPRCRALNGRPETGKNAAGVDFFR